MRGLGNWIEGNYTGCDPEDEVDPGGPVYEPDTREEKEGTA